MSEDSTLNNPLPVQGQIYLNYTGNMNDTDGMFANSNFSKYKPDLRFNPHDIGSSVGRSKNDLTSGMRSENLFKLPVKKNSSYGQQTQPQYQPPQQPSQHTSMSGHPSTHVNGFHVLNKDSLNTPPQQGGFPVGNFYMCPICSKTATRASDTKYRNAECQNGHRWFVKDGKKHVGDIN